LNHFALGIDTGGTFTDGVIYDLDQGRIVVKTKVITTRNDLSIAVENCMDNLVSELKGEDEAEKVLTTIKMVSLSTTLATNAIVEGQGAEVGLISIGYEIKKDLPTTHHAAIQGGCDIKGRIKKEVDIEAAREAIETMMGKVEAFAVSGYMSIRNPEQELTVKKLIEELSGCPVVCAHQLSAELGIYERTVTAVLNARLIPLVNHLIDAVKKSLHARNITAPLMVVKGDGSLISEKAAKEKPVETILSGPAASIVGARALSAVYNGLVVDMGGTTTDIAVLKDGKPAIKEEGAQVGGWLTRVKAAEITTIGLGGDSFIQVSKDRVLSIGPQKVFPLSWIVSEYPHLLDELNSIAQAIYFPLNSQPTCIFVFIKEPADIVLTDTERQILELIREKPHSLYYISRKLEKDVNILGWERLVKIGSIHRANLTPTDILHVVNSFNRWNKEAASLGVNIMSKRFNTSIEKFIHTVLNDFYYKLFKLIIEKIVYHKMGRVILKDSEESNYLLSRMFYDKELKGDDDIKFSVRVYIPVVAVGAPAAAYFPDVVQLLHGDLLLPPDADVANAVGTVNGKVVERVKILIKPSESGGYFVYTPEERKMFMDFDESIEYCESFGKSYARRKAEDSGASDIEVIVERNDRYGTLALTSGVVGNEDKIFIESIINISANGNPW